MKSAITKLGYKLEVKPDDRDASTDRRLQEMKDKRRSLLFRLFYLSHYCGQWLVISHLRRLFIYRIC